MIPLPEFAGRTVAVFGLARSGLASARALAASGAEIWAWDDDPGQRAAAAAAGLRLVDLAACDWSGATALVLSPGIPHSHPAPNQAVARARAARCPVIGDIELLLRARPQARFVGVTGTNGKSTTTALIGHLLTVAGRRVEIGGNLGAPALSLAPLEKDGIYLLEMSSYQLELTPSAGFAVAVLLNVTADHLGRHGGFAGYVAAKKRIFAGGRPGDTAIVGMDDEASRAVAAELRSAGGARLVPISSGTTVASGVYVIDAQLFDASENGARRILDLRAAPALPGAHNWQNAAAAYAAGRALGLDSETIAEGLRSYPGLAHRQELVALIEGVRFVNDSKATNADATGKALACYDAVYWIVGGRPKEGGLAVLEPFYRRVRHAFLIGEAAADFARALEGKVPATVSGTLEAAVAQAHALARRERRPGAVVLLSPACASFDQFANFEERGETFRRLVTARMAQGSAGRSRPAPLRALS